MTDAPDYDAIRAEAVRVRLALTGDLAGDALTAWTCDADRVILDQLCALRDLEAKVAGIQDANNIAAAHRFDLDRVGDQEHIDWLASLGEKPKGGPDNFYNGVQFATTRVRRAILDSKDQT